MYQIAQNFMLRLILSFNICASLLLLPGVSLLSKAITLVKRIFDGAKEWSTSNPVRSIKIPELLSTLITGMQ
jgi:hypothetical protein